MHISSPAGSVNVTPSIALVGPECPIRSITTSSQTIAADPSSVARAMTPILP